MSSTATRVIKNTGYLYAKMGITMFVSLYTTRLILNGLGASDFGIFNIVGGAIAMLGFLNAAMASATQRFMSYAEGEGNKEGKKTIFNVSALLHLVLAISVAVILSAAGFMFFKSILNIPKEREVASIIVYGSLIVSTSLTISTVPYDAVLNSHENMKYYSLVGIIESLLKLAVAFCCVNSSYDKLIVYGVLMAVIPFITLNITRIYCHTHYEECKLDFKQYFKYDTAKDIATFAGWNFLYTATSMFTMQGISILLNIFGGVVVNAAHGIANQLSGQLIVFSNNMLKALNPVLIKSRAANQNDLLLEAAATGNKISFITFSFFTIPFIVETPTILSLWLKEAPEWTTLFVRLVLIREMLIQTYITYETCIQATGKIKDYVIASSIIWLSPTIIAFIAYKLGAPIYTIYLLLILMAIVRGYNVIVHLKKNYELDIFNYLRSTVVPCIIPTSLFIAALFTITASYDKSIYRLIFTALISFTSYPFICYFITFNSKERYQVSSTIQRLKEKILS